MNRQIRNILFLLGILTVFCSWTEPGKFSFVDKFGNTIIIENPDKLPRHLDTTFLKSNLTGLLFNQKLTESPLRFDYILFEVTTIKKSKEYELRVFAVPHSSDPQILLKHQNWTHDSLTIKKIENIFVVEKVDCLYGAI